MNAIATPILKKEECAPEFRMMQVDQSSPLSLKNSSVNSKENLRYKEDKNNMEDEEVILEENRSPSLRIENLEKQDDPI